MKCRACGKEANIRLSAYNTALCADDFLIFFERRVTRTIQKYNLIGTTDSPLVAVSGGKDSLSLWYILNHAGFSADGIYVDLGIDEYSHVSFEKAKLMAARLGRKIYRFSLPALLQKGIGDLSKLMKRAPCSLCGVLKRYLMNRACVDCGYTVLATGHNLDDEASALFGNLLYWKEEYLYKKSISLEARGDYLAKKVKPFFLCSEREAAAYAILRQIDYVYEECPYSVGAKTLLYKDLLNKIEITSPATKIRFIKGYLDRVKEEGARVDPGRCTRCGYPSYTETCNVCKLFERFGTGEALRVECHEPANAAFAQATLTEADSVQ
ncbi:MAG TPA: TIGR00269 family protein [Syntrophorhabdales bacterium]|nr:TIGR00269 family protein [Syntrophorhabdales bacterium]